MCPHKIGVCSWSLQPDVPDSLIERVRQCGMSAIQLALGPLVMPPGAEVWGRAVSAIREAGIEILSGMMAFAGEDYSTLQSIARTGGVRPDAMWPANREHARAVADIAAAADIGLVTFHAGFIPEVESDPERAKLLDRLRQIADLFDERNVALALETGQETADTLLAALAELDRPNVGVNFDPANMILYGKGDPVAALKKLSSHVRQVHIKDAAPAAETGRWGTEVAAGKGAVDWPAFFEIARAIVPRVNYVIEREAGGSRLDDVQAAAALVREQLGQPR